MKFTAKTLTPPANDHEAVRARWGTDKRRAFQMFAPASLSLVATDGPVSVTLWDGDTVKHRFGHNRGVWPAKLAKGSGWRDAVTGIYDKNPFFFLGTQFRLWARTPAARDQLAAAVVELIAARSDRDGGLDVLGNGFADLGADLDLALFELEVETLARQSGVQIWDDIGLSALLDRVVLRAHEIRAAGRSGRYDAVEVALAREIEG